jgi:hypothetical protein
VSLTYSQLAVHAQLRAVAQLLNGGTLELYDDRVDGPLVSFAFADPAFTAPADGEMAAHPFEPSAPVPRAGEARIFRCVTAGGNEVLTGDIGTGDADLVLTDTAIYRGTRVTIDAFTITE